MLVALITAAFTLLGVWLTAFLAEDYRRFRDGSAMAAALAGELGSYALAMENAEVIFMRMATSIHQGEMQVFPSERPPKIDPVFDSTVPRIGLLGVEVAENVVFTYHMIRAWRGTLRSAAAAPNVQSQLSSILVGISFLQEAMAGTPALLDALNERSDLQWAKYRNWHPSGLLPRSSRRLIQNRVADLRRMLDSAPNIPTMPAM